MLPILKMPVCFFFHYHREEVFLREIILNFHGIGEPPSHVPDEERPYWISIKYFSDVVRSRLDVAPKFYPVLSSLVTF
jgi:hypothetical protein